VDLTAMGRVGLTGFKGKIAEQVAAPISESTRMTKEQVEAIFGALFLLLTFWQFYKLFRRVWRAGREGELSVTTAD
jgi:hypothetical protein